MQTDYESLTKEIDTLTTNLSNHQIRSESDKENYLKSLENKECEFNLERISLNDEKSNLDRKLKTEQINNLNLTAQLAELQTTDKLFEVAIENVKTRDTTITQQTTKISTLEAQVTDQNNLLENMEQTQQHSTETDQRNKQISLMFGLVKTQLERLSPHLLKQLVTPNSTLDEISDAFNACIKDYEEKLKGNTEALSKIPSYKLEYMDSLKANSTEEDKKINLIKIFHKMEIELSKFLLTTTTTSNKNSVPD